MRKAAEQNRNGTTDYRNNVTICTCEDSDNATSRDYIRTLCRGSILCVKLPAIQRREYTPRDHIHFPASIQATEMILKASK